MMLLYRQPLCSTANCSLMPAPEVLVPSTGNSTAAANNDKTIQEVVHIYLHSIISTFLVDKQFLLFILYHCPLLGKCVKSQHFQGFLVSGNRLF